MNRLILLLYRNAHSELTPMEQAIKSVVESPFSVEILYDVITELRLKAGLSDYEARQIIINNYNDWDK